MQDASIQQFPIKNTFQTSYFPKSLKELLLFYLKNICFGTFSFFLKIKPLLTSLFAIGLFVKTVEIAERDGVMIAERMIDVLEDWWWLFMIILEGSFGLGVHRQY